MPDKKKFIADFHIHSHYSRATSRNLTPEFLNTWAKIKGLNIVGSGDFTHPGWLKELEEKLETAEPGLFKIKKEYDKNINELILNIPENDVRFILTGEISSIYKKNDKVRKIHNVVFAPNFDVVRKIQNKLSKIGNITSDGRPILGLDAKDLLDILLNISDECFLVPAHIWTPWFSILGSKSGFDKVEECFEELTPHIFAIETGLSSDPEMNWKCSFLDKFSIISNSDAHSPENLAREANLFNAELSYYSIKKSLKENNEDFLGTIEFYPQEGKYHYDGHRKCNVCLNPIDSIKNNLNCPECGKPLTLGVMYRVTELSDRFDITTKTNRKKFYSLIPLKEIISELLGVSKTSKRVIEKYYKLINKLGSEISILKDMAIDQIKKEEPLLAEGISRMRNGEIHIQEGYDGEYGVIKVFQKNEIDTLKKDFLFYSKDENKFEKKMNKKRKITDDEIIEFKKEVKIKKLNKFEEDEILPDAQELNDSQLKAVGNIYGPNLIIAGPGTGKTLVLVYKIIEIIKSGINPENILVLTFSNLAAKEIKDRIKKIISNENISDLVNVHTFHSYGLSIIKENLNLLNRSSSFSIINEEEKENILKNNFSTDKKKIKQFIEDISKTKQHISDPNLSSDEELKKIFFSYNEKLFEYNLLDFDDMLYIPLNILTENKNILEIYKNKYKWILVDEYQDINLIQYELIRLLADSQNSNITVIGDPNQAIYGFRGASIQFIRNFSADYKNEKTFFLDTSYRCSNNILNASQQVITGEKLSYLSGLQEGTKITINEFNTDKSEAEFVARKIESLIGGVRFFSMDSGITDGTEANDYHFSNFAVLIRVGSQMKCLEKAFFDHGIPFQKIGNAPFYYNPPFDDIISLLKIVIKKENKYLLNSISFKTFKLKEPELSDLKNILEKDGLNFLFKFILEKYFNTIINEYQIEIETLHSLTNEYNSIPDEFLYFLSTNKSIDIYERKFDAVKLMTMHSAKGLEFEIVFIPGCNDKIIPFTFFENYRVDIEEEKRLLYVAMTRAKKNLFLSYSNSMSVFNQKIKTAKSQFIDKIKNELIAFEKHSLNKKNDSSDGQLSLF